MLHVLRAVPLLAPAVAAVDGVVRAPVRAIADPAPHLRARQNQVEVHNPSNGTLYTIEIQVGTPPQTQEIIIDTGSPDTWFNPTCETSNAVRSCRAIKQFDPSKSGSFQDLDAQDFLQYGIGNVTVNWVTETLTIGSATIENQVVGIGAGSQEISHGIFGLSPPIGGENEYSYVLDTMKEQGLIKSRAFSLDLRGFENPNGAVIFGGIDTGKFIGELVKLPMLPQEETPRGLDRYFITMTGIGLTFPDGSMMQSEELDVPVFLDSGATLSHLPTRIFEALADSFPEGIYDPERGYYFLPCGLTEVEGSIDFYFAGKTIRVPLKEFIWQTGEFCILGVKAKDTEPVLGDTFLRAAYVVYDQDNRELWMAQAANCGEELVAIGSGDNAVPKLTGQCTELPTPTGTRASLDVTRTRVPSHTVTGIGATINPLGPGPAGSRTGSALQPSQSTDAAGRTAGLGSGTVLAFAVVNLLAWVL